MLVGVTEFVGVTDIVIDGVTELVGVIDGVTDVVGVMDGVGVGETAIFTIVSTSQGESESITYTS